MFHKVSFFCIYKAFILKIKNMICSVDTIWINVFTLEVCTGPGLAWGPYPARQIRGDFSIGPGRQMRDDFPMGRAGTTHEGWFFQRDGPAHERGFFERAGPAKRDMSFLTVESGYKERRTNNLTSQSGLKKQRQSFETDS